MLLKFVKSYKVPVLFFMFFLGLSVFFSPFRTIKHVILPYEQEPLIVFSFLFRITAWSRIFELTIATILVILQALLINGLNRKFSILHINSYLPGILFILISGSLMPLHRVHPLLFSGFLILLAIDQVFSTISKVKNIEFYFNAGFYIFIASLFYAGTALLILLIYAGLILFRKFNWREWLMPIMGFLTPVLILCGIMYLGNNFNQFFTNYFSNFRFRFVSFEDYNVSIQSLLFYSFVGFLTIIASIKYKNKKIVPRKYFIFFFILFCFSLCIFLFFDYAFMGMILIIAIPVSYLLSLYLINLKSLRIGNALIWILFILALFVRILG